MDPNKEDTQSLARNHIIEVGKDNLITIAGNSAFQGFIRPLGRILQIHENFLVSGILMTLICKQIMRLRNVFAEIDFASIEVFW